MFEFRFRSSSSKPVREEATLCRLIVSLNEKGILKSARDLSLGGIGIALAKTVLLSGLGIEADLSSLRTERNDLTLFGESAASVLVGFTAENTETVRKAAESAGLRFYLLGKTNATRVLEVVGSGVRVSFDEMSGPYESGLESVFAL
ncbi:AIR synthase-related protein [Leptospira ellisii]|uniref:AIR synthase-related protein n=1 Tax=Leptospira ellisii TaxID=2023197 RepID=UPI001FAE7867|nr:AIR synthase-related protein [Leptospira ellisii]